MAKQVSILDALDALAAMGIELSPAQTKALAEAKQKAFHDDAAKVFKQKAADDVDVNSEAWVETVFEMASNVARDIKPITRQQGRGVIVERMFAVETPEGKFKVSLTTGADD